MTSRTVPVPTITPTKPRFVGSSASAENEGNPLKTHKVSSWDDESILLAAQQVASGQSDAELNINELVDMFDFTDNDLRFRLNPRQLPKNFVSFPIKKSPFPTAANDDNDSSVQEDDSRSQDFDDSWESEEDSNAADLDESWESDADLSAQNLDDAWESQTMSEICNDDRLYYFPTPETSRQTKKSIHPKHIRCVTPIKGKRLPLQSRMATPLKGKRLPQQESREPHPDTWEELSQEGTLKRDHDASARWKTPTFFHDSSIVGNAEDNVTPSDMGIKSTFHGTLDKKVQHHQLPWTVEEEEIIREYRKKNIKYSAIQAQLPGRTCIEIRDHFENVIDPNLLKTRLTIQEKLIILEKRQRFGNRWNLISTFLPRRSVDQIKKFWLRTKLSERRRFRRTTKSE